jgi:peptidoglycan LD-endopeptidase CwlK
MTWTLTTRDETRLSDIDEKLASVVRRAAETCPNPFMVTEGRRTQQRQDDLYAQGRTKPGKIVTWTKDSKHIKGEAVDVAPLADDGSIPWGDIPRFDEIAQHMFAAAKLYGVNLRWGADWDRDGQVRERGESDSPHFEI